ncbi:ABC transporter permease [Ornithinimicrobium murale]|uniref:ABC transporter permease n=1 Tax=Ornithinimicrobium murale TaxID=1050153 RepID=UPI000E0D144A|nr:iron ABC transporter permease [Ornithinimicrobium murale]
MTEITSAAKLPAVSTVRAGHGLVRKFMPWLLGVLLLVVVALIVYPIGRMVIASFYQEGAFTLEPVRAVLNSEGIGRVVWNTIVYTVGTLVVATSIGGLLAWINERTDARINWLAGVLPLIPLLIPPIGSALGYVLLFDERAGVFNAILRQLLGIAGNEGPVSVANFPGLILVSSINLAPLAYLVISAAFRNVDPALDEASRVFGAGHLRTLRRVTLPVIRPALASGSLVVGIMAVGAFTYPLIIGTSAGITTLPVYIYRLFSVYPPQEDVAITLGVMMLLVIQVAVVLQMRVARSVHRSTIAGKRSSNAVVRLGKWRWVLRLFIIAYVCAVILPLIGLVIGSLQPYRASVLDPSTFTLDTYRSVLTNPLTQESLLNSFTLGAVAALLVMAVSAVLIYSTSRSIGKGGRLVEGVLFMPASIPHTVIGAAFLFTFSRPPLILYGTPLLLLFAYIVAFMPQGASAAASAVSQSSKELSEASNVSGAGPLRTLVRVVLPQMLPGLVAGWVIVFFLAVNEVTASALLAGLGTSVVGHLAVDFFNNGRLADVAVLAILVTAITATVVGAVSRLASRSFRTGVPS